MHSQTAHEHLGKFSIKGVVKVELMLLSRIDLFL